MKKILFISLIAIILFSCSKRRDCEYQSYGIYFHSEMMNRRKIESDRAYWYWKVGEVDHQLMNQTLKGKAEHFERLYRDGDNVYIYPFERGTMSCYDLKQEMEYNEFTGN